jgi:ankyrin repeat protein
VKLLLKEKADIHATNNWMDQRTPIIYALQNGYIHIAKLLLNNGATISKENEHKLLFNASKKGHLGVIKLLFTFVVKVDAAYRDSNHHTILMAACTRSDLQIIELLLQRIDDVNAHHNDLGKNALMVACEHGHYNAVQLLLQHRADLNVVDIFGKTALMYARESGNDDVIRLLLNTLANAYAKTKLGNALGCQNTRPRTEEIIGSPAPQPQLTNAIHSAVKTQPESTLA